MYIQYILIARASVHYGEIFYKDVKYSHEPKASENTSMRVKCHSHIVSRVK